MASGRHADPARTTSDLQPRASPSPCIGWGDEVGLCHVGLINGLAHDARSFEEVRSRRCAPARRSINGQSPLLGVLALAATACESDTDSADGSAASDPDVAISLPSDEDKAAIDTTVQAVLESSGDAIPALYLTVRQLLAVYPDTPLS
jgi:hypothetical protein